MTFKTILLENAEEFLSELAHNNKKLTAKMVRVIELLENFGTQLQGPYSKKIRGSNLWELRARVGSDICRVFFIKDNESFVILSGYTKKEQKTKKSEIKKAEKIRISFLRRTK